MIRTWFRGDWFLGACLAVALGAPAFAQSIVVLNGNASAVGGDNSGPLPSTPISAELQIDVGPGQFNTGPIYITGFTFRAAPGFGPLSLTVVGNTYLSTSPKWPNSNFGPLLSTTFASNVGPDKTLVLSGSNTINGAGCAVSGTTPCPWASNFVFTTPFHYNPASGPLLIDVQATSFSATGRFDVVDCSAPGCGTANIFGTPLGSATAISFNYGDSVLQLTYTSNLPSVPALGTWGLLILGGALLLLGMMAVLASQYAS